jgi:predicted nucleic acid-binding protein
MSAVNYGEIFAVLQRTHGRDRALSVLATLHPLPITVEDATRHRAISAADIRVRHKLYYADAFAAALAIEKKATLVTSDSDFRRLGHGFPVLWLKT